MNSFLCYGLILGPTSKSLTHPPKEIPRLPQADAPALIPWLPQVNPTPPPNYIRKPQMWERAHMGCGGAGMKRKGTCMKQCAWRKHGLCDTRLAEVCPPKLRNTVKCAASIGAFFCPGIRAFTGFGARFLQPFPKSRVTITYYLNTKVAVNSR